MDATSDCEIPERVLLWAAAAVDPQARIHSVRRLHGGVSSLVHNITFQVGGAEKEVVLRQFTNREWLQDESDLAHHEAESLRLASRVAICTPQIIAYDETGSTCGIPAVLMTRLEGKVILEPMTDMEHWIDGLAAALVRIHHVDADGFAWSYFTYNDVNSLGLQSWSSIPEKWNHAFEIVKGPQPVYKPCFIHRDYHPANVLWQQHQVSGVVDWVNSCRGPAGIDIGHCRFNLAQLHGVHAADAFLEAYQRHAGSAYRHDPYWDLLSLVNILFGPPEVYEGWTALGVSGLTDQLMAERLDAYLATLI